MSGQRRPDTHYGPNKYAALHLLFCRWLRHYAYQGEYCYVTLAGARLLDILSLAFIDANLVKHVIAFEKSDERYEAALCEKESLSLTLNCEPEIIHGNFFDFKRTVDVPHIFFFDGEGQVLPRYAEYFRRLLEDGRIIEGDALFLTSSTARTNVGKIVREFDSAFRVLRIANKSEKAQWFKRCHPNFTLFRAIEDAHLLSELELVHVGSVEYYDSSLMGLYSFHLREGTTGFANLMRGGPHFTPQWRRR